MVGDGGMVGGRELFGHSASSCTFLGCPDGCGDSETMLHLGGRVERLTLLGQMNPMGGIGGGIR